MEYFASQDPRFYSLYFDLNIWFRARKVTGTFEKRAPAPEITNQKKGLFARHKLKLFKWIFTDIHRIFVCYRSSYRFWLSCSLLCFPARKNNTTAKRQTTEWVKIDSFKSKWGRSRIKIQQIEFPINRIQNWVYTKFYLNNTPFTQTIKHVKIM